MELGVFDKQWIEKGTRTILSQDEMICDDLCPGGALVALLPADIKTELLTSKCISVPSVTLL